MHQLQVASIHRQIRSFALRHDVINALLMDMRGKDSARQVWPIQTIVSEIEGRLFSAAAAFLAPSSDEMAKM